MATSAKAQKKEKRARAKKRQQARFKGNLAGIQAHARLTGKTGSADHWLGRVQRAKALKDSLGRMPTAVHVEACPEMAFVTDRYPTMLGLTEAPYEDLLKLKGVGPARLRKLRAYLSKNNVLAYWKVPV